jgi:2-phospho-L-lactate guanylyltransferase
VREAIVNADAVVVCPSNPITSVGPMLAVPGMVDALGAAAAPVTAVSPIVAGTAVSGPAGALMRARGVEVSPLGLARAYAPWLSRLVIDERDRGCAAPITRLGLGVVVTDTLMTTPAVPAKDLADAKQRLVSVLSPVDRAELARAMLRDVLRALTAAPLDAIWVVTRDPGVDAVARAAGVGVLPETQNRGHTAAVAHAQAEAVRIGARVFVTIPGDVPCVTADEIRRLVQAAAPGAPAFVPSRSGLGTNGVALAPPEAMPLTFGEPSFENHLAAARARRLEPRVLSLPGLALDVDAPDDLDALLAAPGATVSARLVAMWQANGRVRPGGVPRAS